MTRQGAVSTGRYRMVNEGQSAQHGLQGMYVLKDSAGCQIYRPTWSGTRTIIRPYPGRNPENPQEWDPFRLSDEPRDFGDWIRRYDMAFSLGNPGVTFITKDPMNKTIDDQQNPVWMLYRSITQAVKNGSGLPSWNPLIFGAAGRSAQLSAPKDGYLLQGVLFEHKSIPFTPPKGSQMDHRPVVMLLSQSAGKALLDKLEERNAEGLPVWEGVTDLDGGYFIQFHQAGTQQRGTGPSRSLAALGSSSVAENMRYEVELFESYNGTVLPNFEGIETLANAHVRLWDTIVRIPTIQEQIGIICNAGIPESAVVYALGDVYGNYIPQHVHEKARQQRNNPSGLGDGPVVGAISTAPAQPAQPARRPRAPMPAPVEEVDMNEPPFDVDDPAPTADQLTPAPAPVASATRQPTHADANRSKATVEALARARQRARQ